MEEYKGVFNSTKTMVFIKAVETALSEHNYGIKFDSSKIKNEKEGFLQLMAVINDLHKKLTSAQEINRNSSKFLNKLANEDYKGIIEENSEENDQNSKNSNSEEMVQICTKNTKNDTEDERVQRLRNELEILKKHSSGLQRRLHNTSKIDSCQDLPYDLKEYAVNEEGCKDDN